MSIVKQERVMNHPRDIPGSFATCLNCRKVLYSHRWEDTQTQQVAQAEGKKHEQANPTHIVVIGLVHRYAR
jgi:hypothetical protein